MGLTPDPGTCANPDSDNGPGRPSEGVRVPIRVPADILAAVDAEALRQGLSRAAMVRDILTDWAARKL